MGKVLRLGRKLYVPSYSEKVLSYDPIAYWMLDEKQGNVAWDVSRNEFHGAYTGVTLGQPGIGDGRTAPFFDGLNDFCDIYSVAFRDRFALTNHAAPGAVSEGTFVIWVKVFNVGVWTDGNPRYVLRLRADADNHTDVQKAGANNRIRMEYEANTILESQNNNGLVTVDWMQFLVTWSKSAGVDGEVKYYQDGVQSGATDTALGVWAGVLAIQTTVIGASTTAPVNPWHGWLAHCAIYGRALTPAEVADLAVI